MPPVTPSAMSIALHVGRLDLLDLLFLDFLHRKTGDFLRPLRLGRAAPQQLPRPLSRHGHELELVHTGSFRSNELTIVSISPAMAASRARSASTMARSRSTHASSSSFTTT